MARIGPRADAAGRCRQPGHRRASVRRQRAAAPVAAAINRHGQPERPRERLPVPFRSAAAARCPRLHEGGHSHPGDINDQLSIVGAGQNLQSHAHAEFDKVVSIVPTLVPRAVSVSLLWRF